MLKCIPANNPANVIYFIWSTHENVKLNVTKKKTQVYLISYANLCFHKEILYYLCPVRLLDSDSSLYIYTFKY